MVLAKESYTAVTRYFNRLSQVGYFPYSEADKMLALIAIQELLESYLFTEEQYKDVERALVCLFGSSCLIPYHEYIVRHSYLGSDRNIMYRCSEDNIKRKSDSNHQRRTE